MIATKIGGTIAIFIVFGCIGATVQLDRKRMIVVDVPGVGKVKGRRIETAWSGKNIFQFFDVKYGESPSGERRFKAPIPAKPWNEVRNAFTPRKGCPALQTIDYVRKNEGKRDVEDCLYLTISTKNLTQNKPVMVYLHGEFLYEGTPLEASPEYLLEKNVVLVAVRYRLAPFGFLSTKTEALPGNAALMDVILALEWIQKYIKYFGGDPNIVTLFGQVGGAAIANVLTMSPKVSPNLFHRVIYQSGSALTPAFTTEHPLKYSKDIGRIAGCPYEDVDKLNRCLVRLNTTTLLEAFGIHGNLNAAKGIGSYGGLQFTVGGPSGVLPEHPGKLVQQKKIRYLPTMGGVVRNAGTFLLKEIFEDNFNGTIPDDKYDANKYIEHIIKQTNGDDPTGAWKNFAEADFFTTKELKDGSFKAMIPGLIDMCGTIAFKNPVLLALKANAAKLPNSTYLYSFNYEGEYNRYLSEEDEYDSDLPFHLGVSLTDENMYLFPWPQHVAYLNNYDTKIAKRMISLWTSFATKGAPRASKIKNWPPMTGETGPYLRIDNSSTIEANFVKEYSTTGQDAHSGDTLVDEEYFLSLLHNEEVDDELEDDDDKH